MKFTRPLVLTFAALAVSFAAASAQEITSQTAQLTTGPEDEDWPAAAAAGDGTVWLAYTSYKNAGPLPVAEIHGQKKFDSLEAEGNGDQVRLVKFDGQAWGEPMDVTEGLLDVWRPAVAVDGDGTVWVVWSQQADGNWDLYARGFKPASGQWTDVARLTTAAGSDINVVALTHPTSGQVHLVWQGWRDGSFDILRATLAAGGLSEEKAVADNPANQWWPAAAFDSGGTLFVAYDTYEAGNYDVKLVSGAAGDAPKTIDVAATEFFEARPSLAVDGNDRVWIAYEEGGQQWGKDTGMRWLGRRGELLYWRREIVVRAVEGDRVLQAAGKVPCEPIRRNYPEAATRRVSNPRLAVDAGGRLWLLFRRHPRTQGGGEVWASFATYHTGDDWAEPVMLEGSFNLLDNRPAVLAHGRAGLLAVHSTDGRKGGTRDAKRNDLYWTTLAAGGDPAPPKLVDPAEPPEPSVVVHPNERDDVKRIRNYRATAGGKTYQLLRGEFHRHTELTAHRDQDGTLEDMWRYGIDAASMDWIGNGDHDNGYGVEYLWWLVQKQMDIYFHPPQFMPMYTYERSVTYPSGHRNAMFTRRGIRPLPRIPGGKEKLYGTPEDGSPDIKTFYAYLKRFDGICASHTSGTNMGTDWRDNDPRVEPIVEIYQGLRHSYEHEGAPATAKGPGDDIGGFRPAGFVWNALMKGYRLGFEVSSDHYSTHISYTAAWAEDTTREALFDALKKRHCYGTNDNIILDVRCGEQMMGDIFALQGKPTLEITVLGTEPVERLSIIRGVGSDAPRYVYDAEPNEREVKLSWTDQDPQWGKTNYYYVRIEQVRPEHGYGALAWASPMWIEVREP